MKKSLAFVVMFVLLVWYAACYAEATFDATGTWTFTFNLTFTDPSGTPQGSSMYSEDLIILQTSANPYDEFTFGLTGQSAFGHVYDDHYVIEGPTSGLPSFVPQDSRPWVFTTSSSRPGYWHRLFEDYNWTVSGNGDILTGYLHCTASGWYVTEPGLSTLSFDPSVVGMVTEGTFTAIRHGSSILVPLDIKPGSCRNPLNVSSRGVIPVAILGSEDLDVSQIDPVSLRLEYTVAPLRSALKDVGTSFYASEYNEECVEDCYELGADGYMDLVLKFDTQEVVSTLGEIEDSDCIILTIEGNLKEEFGGTPILGEDAVLILKKK